MNNRSESRLVGRIGNALPLLILSIAQTLLRVRLAAVMSVLCIACTGIVIAPAGSRIDVALARGAAADTWIAELTPPASVRAVRWVRNPDDSRRRLWGVDPAFEIVRQGDVDILRRKDGAAFRRVAISVPARYRVLPKDYAPFSPFADGGMLIHSGQFHACAGTAECPDDPRPRVTVRAPTGSQVIVAGERSKRATFQDSADGTNIYVGNATPLETERYIAVIDAHLPSEVRDSLYQLLPPLMQYFTGRLGALERKPMLFASLDPHSPSGSGFSSQGGTLPDQIFMHLYGEDWQAKAAQRQGDFLPWFFAHEAAHLFQFRNANRAGFDLDQSWIHEGGADAFAALTVAKLGGATAQYVGARTDAALESCAVGLKVLGKALNASSSGGAFENYYTCGLLMQLAIHTEVNQSSAGARDLFDVWALFQTRVRSGQPWNQETFLGAAREMGAPVAAELARTLATVPQADPEAFLRRLSGRN